MIIFTARSKLRKVLLLALSVTFLFVYEISREQLNGFAPNSHGRLVWSLARASSPGTKNGIFRPFPRPACGLCLVKQI